MEHESLLAQFFELENRREWGAYQSILHPQIEWVLCSAGTQQTFCGISAYMERITAAYANSGVTFQCRQLLVSTSGARIVAVLENTHGEVSVDIFEFQDGLIIREYEFLMG